MNLTPLLSAPPAVQIHAFSALAALVLGALVLFRRKGTPLHKAMGRVWALLMLVTATSSLFINDIRMFGPFSPIHGFALITYFGLAEGIVAIRRRRVEAHRKAMVGLYFMALVLAGAFTFLPGRRMYHVVFGTLDMPWLSYTLVGAIVVAALVAWRWRDIAALRARLA